MPNCTGCRRMIGLPFMCIEASAPISGNPFVNALQKYFPVVSSLTFTVKLADLPTICKQEEKGHLVLWLTANIDGSGV